MKTPPLAEQQREESFFDPRRVGAETEASYPTTLEKLHILDLYVGIWKSVRRC